VGGKPQVQTFSSIWAIQRLSESEAETFLNLSATIAILICSLMAIAATSFMSAYAPAVWLNVNVSSSAIRISGIPPVEILTACANVSCAPGVAAHASKADFEGK